MASAAVLGIALAAMVRAHTTSIRGTARAEDIGRATEIARQIGDTIAGQPIDQMPAACGAATDAAPVEPAGCRASIGPGTVMAVDKTAPCTRLVLDDGAIDASTGDLRLVDDGVAQYRIDMTLSQHPLGGEDLALLHVWVCWRDEIGHVHEVATTRTKKVGFW